MTLPGGGWRTRSTSSGAPRRSRKRRGSAAAPAAEPSSMVERCGAAVATRRRGRNFDAGWARHGGSLGRTCEPRCRRPGGKARHARPRLTARRRRGVLRDVVSALRVLVASRSRRRPRRSPAQIAMHIAAPRRQSAARVRRSRRAVRLTRHRPRGLRETALRSSSYALPLGGRAAAADGRRTAVLVPASARRPASLWAARPSPPACGWAVQRAAARRLGRDLDGRASRPRDAPRAACVSGRRPGVVVVAPELAASPPACCSRVRVATPASGWCTLARRTAAPAPRRGLARGPLRRDVRLRSAALRALARRLPALVTAIAIDRPTTRSSSPPSRPVDGGVQRSPWRAAATSTAGLRPRLRRHCRESRRLPEAAVPMASDRIVIVAEQPGRLDALCSPPPDALAPPRPPTDRGRRRPRRRPPGIARGPYLSGDPRDAPLRRARSEPDLRCPCATSDEQVVVVDNRAACRTRARPGQRGTVATSWPDAFPRPPAGRSAVEWPGARLDTGRPASRSRLAPRRPSKATRTPSGRAR